MNGRTIIKLLFASLAFVPLAALGLIFWESAQESIVFKAALLFHLPAISLSQLAESFWGQRAAMATLILTVPAWDFCVALFLWKCVEQFFENNPAGLKEFDWAGFFVRASCGAVLGALIGWRIWIKFGASASIANLIITIGTCSLVLALGMGALYRENFWGRPL